MGKKNYKSLISINNADINKMLVSSKVHWLQK